MIVGVAIGAWERCCFDPDVCARAVVYWVAFGGVPDKIPAFVALEEVV